MAGITIERRKSIIFIVIPKQRKQLKVIAAIYGRKW